MTILSLTHISKSFQDGKQMRQILKEVSLTVQAKEFVAILGPSGSGKSTLLSIAGLLLSADSGQITIADQDLTNLKQAQWTKKRNELLGFIFQDHQLLPYMTIGDQLHLVAKMKGQKKLTDNQKTIQNLLHDLAIEDTYQQLPGQLSGGQKQRVAIARAFMGNPQLILADEPTASLDPKRGQEIAKLIQKEVKEKEKAALMVTHDHSILDYVDTIYELKEGQLLKLS